MYVQDGRPDRAEGTLYVQEGRPGRLVFVLVAQHVPTRTAFRALDQTDAVSWYSCANDGSWQASPLFHHRVATQGINMKQPSLAPSIYYMTNTYLAANIDGPNVAIPSTLKKPLKSLPPQAGKTFPTFEGSSTALVWIPPRGSRTRHADGSGGAII